MNRILLFLLLIPGPPIAPGHFRFADQPMSPAANVDIRVNSSSDDAEEEGPEVYSWDQATFVSIAATWKSPRISNR